MRWFKQESGQKIGPVFSNLTSPQSDEMRAIPRGLDAYISPGEIEFYFN